MKRVIKRSVLAVAIAVAFAATQADAGLIVNGDFETGDLSGWTVVNEAGGAGSFYIQSGTSSPLSGRTVDAPPGGTYAAMSDQPNMSGQGSHILYQDFTVPLNITSATLSFDRYIQNLAFNFLSPNSLSYLTPGNQQARVDIILTTDDIYTTTVLQAIWGTQWGDPLVQSYTTDITALLQAFAGQTLRLRFSEVSNLAGLNFGLDNIDITYTTDNGEVPEPSTLLLCSLGGLGLVGLGIRRRKRTA